MSEEQKQDSPAEGSEESPAPKQSLKDRMNLKAATNKVNAEALRQFQIDGEGRFTYKLTKQIFSSSGTKNTLIY